MGKLVSFNFVTMDGYFEGPHKGDISWHKNQDPEKDEYGNKGLQADSILLFGRVTYNMMAQFWPSPMAAETMPEMAAGMNRAEKIVFSRTLKNAEWNNTRIIRDNIFDAVKALKRTSPKDMTILGSGSIVTQFAQQGLIDECQLMIDPLVIGAGTPMFKKVSRQLNFTLKDAQTFRSGVVVLTYLPA